MNKYRTHTCGELAEIDIGQLVTISGWIHRKRDHGNLLFIDLRDHYGITQCVIESDSRIFADIEKIRHESVITIQGEVVKRSEETINSDIKTGKIEIKITSFGLLSHSDELPLNVFGDQEYPEETRLKYRFLDLRRERMHNNIVLRTKIISNIRKSMEKAGFSEFHTPILTSSSPEGARDFLVPSRMHPGKFYALPQAPQLFKQLIMISGFDRYFQISPCFRDEDPRADRSPGEFYQLDIEMSFVEQKDVFSTIEPIVLEVFSKNSNFTISDKPFVQIPYSEAMLKYGIDKPDLRIPIELTDVTDTFTDSNFKIFSNAIKSGSVVRAIPVPSAASQPRSFFDSMNDWAQKEHGAAGLGYIIFGDKPTGPIAKNLSSDRIDMIRKKANINNGDAVFFSCAKSNEAALLAGAARIEIASKLDLIEENTFRFCWITDFPLFEYNEESKKIEFGHNPFSMPKGGMDALRVSNPLEIVSNQYDLVCNGTELASGAIRNHIPEVMIAAFEIAGYDASEVKKRFGGLYNALHYGTPPHGGLAFGLERILMLIANEKSLREVVLFPMNQKGEDLLMSAPASVSKSHLKELSIKTIEIDSKISS